MQSSVQSLLLCGLEVSVDIINPALQPGRIEPFGRLDGNIGDIDRIVKVIASGHAGIARPADDLSLVNIRTRADIHLRQVGIHGKDMGTVIDDNAVAINTEILGKDDNTIVGGLDRHLGETGDIDAVVGLPVDLHIVKQVGAMFGILRLGCAKIAVKSPIPERLGTLSRREQLT